MEQNLISPCDLSPIQPKQMSEAETLKNGMNMEKLLMERVMLRKELKLRSMQERLLDQTRKLEEAEQRLEEFERLPGITQFMAMVRLGQQVSQTGGTVAQRTVSYLVLLYQVNMVIAATLKDLFEIVLKDFFHLSINDNF